MKNKLPIPVLFVVTVLATLTIVLLWPLHTIPAPAAPAVSAPSAGFNTPF